MKLIVGRRARGNGDVLFAKFNYKVIKQKNDFFFHSRRN